jgi:hypothetical protein
MQVNWLRGRKNYEYVSKTHDTVAQTSRDRDRSRLRVYKCRSLIADGIKRLVMTENIDIDPVGDLIL